MNKMVSGEGLEPSWLPTRPSNVRVYQFRHPDADERFRVQELDKFSIVLGERTLNRCSFVFQCSFTGLCEAKNLSLAQLKAPILGISTVGF
jgi:hypothetical protein